MHDKMFTRAHTVENGISAKIRKIDRVISKPPSLYLNEPPILAEPDFVAELENTLSHLYQSHYSFELSIPKRININKVVLAGN